MDERRDAALVGLWGRIVIAHVAADGMIRGIHLKLSPFLKVDAGDRFVPADPPPYDEATQRPVPVEPVPADAFAIDYTFDTITLPVPERVTRFQAKAALAHFDYLATIEAVMADQATPALYRLAWMDAVHFERNAQTVAAMGQILSLTDAQLDDLFRYAATVSA
jgi:hypothetical protein